MEDYTVEFESQIWVEWLYFSTCGSEKGVFQIGLYAENGYWSEKL